MKFHIKIIPLSIAVAFGGASGLVYGGPFAIEMSARADYTLGAGGQISVRDPALPGPPDVRTGSVDVLLGNSDGSGNNVFFHGYGYTSGPYSFFGSRASGGGIFDAKSTFHLQQVYEANGPAQPYLFNFIVDNGELSANCLPCTGGGTATLDIKIGVDETNDGSIDQTFTGNASLVVNGDGSYSFARSGLAASLTGIPANAAGGGGGSANLNFGWDATPMSINLGSFGDDQQFRLEYDLVARATGAFSAASVDCSRTQFNREFPDGENPINVAAGGGQPTLNAVGEGQSFCTGWLPGTGARAGDPGGIQNYWSDPSSGIQTAAAPEPVSTSLLGLGLGAALLAGRRRRKTKV